MAEKSKIKSISYSDYLINYGIQYQQLLLKSYPSHTLIKTDRFKKMIEKECPIIPDQVQQRKPSGSHVFVSKTEGHKKNVTITSLDKYTGEDQSLSQSCPILDSSPKNQEERPKKNILPGSEKDFLRLQNAAQELIEKVKNNPNKKPQKLNEEWKKEVDNFKQMIKELSENKITCTLAQKIDTSNKGTADYEKLKRSAQEKLKKERKNREKKQENQRQ